MSNVLDFKNFIPYSLKCDAIDLSDMDTFHDLILSQAYHQLQPSQISSIKFLPLNGTEADYPYYYKELKDNSLNTIGLLMRICISKRNLPSSVIKKEVNKRVKEIEKRNKVKLSKKEITPIKEQVFNELAELAFVNEKNVDILIDLKKDRIFVGTTSLSIAENCFSVLRKALNSLPVMPFIYKKSISYVLNRTFLEQDIETTDNKVSVSVKFKLIETGHTSNSLTNNSVECSLPYMKELVNEDALQVNQLELVTQKASFIICAPKIGGNNMPTYKTVRTSISEIVDGILFSRVGNADNEDQDQLLKETYQLTGIETLKVLNEIVDITQEICGGVLE